VNPNPRSFPRRLVLVALLACWPAPSLFAGEPGAEAALQAAAEHERAGRWREAADALEAALEPLADRAARAPLEAALGGVLVRAGETYAALQYLQSAATVRGAPEDHVALAEALLALARRNAASGTGRWIEIVPYLQDAVTEAAEGAAEERLRGRRLAVVGEARRLLGEPEAAAEAFGGLHAGDLPEAEAARVADLHARVLYDLGRFEEAARAFDRAGNARGVASAWAAARNGPEAVAVYARLLRDAPGDPALLQEAVAAARYAGAEAELAGALSDLDVEGTARAPVLVARALLAESGGAPEAAERLARTATEADPALARAWYELGRLRLVSAGGSDDRLDAAIDALVEALARAPFDEALVRLLWDVAGRDYALLWRSPRAGARSVEVQRALVEATPEDELAWANLGNTLRVTGRLEEAVEAYDRALALEDGDPAILSDRGLALSALGRHEAAQEAFQAAVRVDPDFDAAHQNAARQHWLAGRDDDAARHLAEAERRTRAAGGNWLRYRFLLDRVYRTGRRPDVR
jgi:tetratricopeptide (TPR) repeat protein